MRDSFVLYASQYDAIENLSDVEIGQIIRKLFLKITRDEDYTCDSKLADGIAKSFFPNIYAASKRYEASVNNGKKGGAPKGNQNAKKQPKTTQEQPTGYFEEEENSDKNNLKQPKTTEEQPTGYFEEEVNSDKNNLKQPKNNLNVNDNDNVNEVLLPESTSIKKKEEYDIDSNTGNRVLNDEEFQKWCYGCVDKFNSGIGIGTEPSVQQVLGFMLDNNEGYYKSFFESYSTNEEGRLQIPLEDVNKHLYQLIQPMASTYGYSISDNSEVLSKFNKWYFKSRLNDIKVDLI